MVAGGSGFNVLVAAARQGLPGVLAGTHGTGPFGDLARAAVAAAGLDLVHRPSRTSTPASRSRWSSRTANGRS
jgi:sugar/nucleoside kinase (ribokinase family)